MTQPETPGDVTQPASRDPSDGSPPPPPAPTRGGLPDRINAPVDFADGRYKLLAEIGRGAMGRVYRAWDTMLQRIVAIKITDAAGWDRTEELRRFRREARAAARLRHRGIVSVHDVVGTEGATCIVMDYIKGTTLGQLLNREERPKMSELLNLFFEIAIAMDHAHGNGIVHRDLKPDNIIIDDTGQPLVADFGLARTSAKPSDLSGLGEALGTPFYMSPEQADGQTDEIGPPSDVWSLGAVLYETFCGRLPFPGDSMLEILSKIIEDEPERPRDVNPQISEELDALIVACMNRDREARPTMRDVAGALRSLLQPQSRRARRIPLGALVVLAAIIPAILTGLVLAKALGGRTSSRAVVTVALTHSPPTEPVSTPRVRIAGSVSDLTLPAIYLDAIRVPVHAGAFDTVVQLADGHHELQFALTPGGAALTEPVVVTVDIRPPAVEAAALRADDGSVSVEGRIADAHPPASVRIDGREAPVDADGAFSARLEAASSGAAVIVEATDTAGNRVRLEIVIEG